MEFNPTYVTGRSGWGHVYHKNKYSQSLSVISICGRFHFASTLWLTSKNILSLTCSIHSDYKPQLLQLCFSITYQIPQFLQSYIFGDITPCSPLRINWCFGGTCGLHLQGRRISQERNQHEAGSKIRLPNPKRSFKISSVAYLTSNSRNFHKFVPTEVKR
jgi:hypothetical protein